MIASTLKHLDKYRGINRNLDRAIDWIKEETGKPGKKKEKSLLTGVCVRFFQQI